VDVDAVLGGLYELVAPHLTEKQRRLLAGAAAKALGRGGGARMARISGLSRPTVYTGVRELDDPPDPGGRIRRPGGGPSAWSSSSRACWPRWTRWSTPTPAGTRKARCGGPASPPASWPTRLARKGSRSATTPSGGC
jgi:hypothetical protein